LSQRTKAEILLALTTLIWGASFVVVKGALADAPPFPFIAFRFILAGLLMFGVMARWRLPRETVFPSILLGTLLFAGFAFQTTGLVTTTPSKSAFITGFSVILVPLIALFQGYRMRPANAAGALLGLLGLYFLVLPSGLMSVNRGDVLSLLGAVAFAIHIVGVSVYTRRFSVRHLAPNQILVVGLLALLASPWAGPGSFNVHWTPRLALAVLGTAIFATAVSFSTQIWAQQYTPPAHTALIFALEPVFAALTSSIVGGERLGGRVLFGSGLVLAGMVISEIWGGTPPTPAEG
jgi:drug/metabolite transporter (DMT)-like permease